MRTGSRAAGGARAAEAAVLLKIAGGMEGVPSDTWDRLAGTGNPFLSHAWLSSLEESGSATSRTGWRPLHAILEREGCPVAAAPLYAKSHSFGEYVFDQGWADAYERAGGRYYPKLQVAVPFTPVTGPRLLAGEADATTRAELAAALETLCGELRLSSLHVTFCTAEEARLLAGRGWLVRRGLQFHWSNHGYHSFEDFLARLTSRRRKMIRRERREAAESGLELRTRTGAELEERELAAFHPLYLATVEKRWGGAYLTSDFFRLVHRRLAPALVLTSAHRNGRMVAAALHLRGPDCLYGRLWGSEREFRFLHFELCYYRALEFAIAHGLRRVEAGAQGTHKLMRGYEPQWTWSAHHLADPGFARAVMDFLERETAGLEAHLRELRAMLPYRRDEGSGPSERSTASSGRNPT